MRERCTHRQMSIGMLLTYVGLAMIFAVAAIVAVALILAADIQSWNPTMLITVFFVITGAISGMFILFK